MRPCNRSTFSRLALTGIAFALCTAALRAQDASPPTDPAPPAQTEVKQTAATPPAQASATLSNVKPAKKTRVAKDDRVKQTKDTKAEVKKDKKFDPLAGKDAQLPDKQLYDKAMAQQKSGHFDVARLDLQTLLNTYPDSQYQMRAKLAVADSWYHEGGSAALTQAEQEYGDFITFFPNAPEASEAQMRIGDIYLKQMDVPDRDFTKATKAEDAYRTMLKQYPDAPKVLTDEAKQKLREVQEVLATRESGLAAFYASHANWPAAIARYQTVIDTYPQYSHMDDTLIGLGDAYEEEAQIVRQQRLTEDVRSALLQEFDGKAADAYRKVVIYHYAAPHVEDAKERLAAMNLPIPRPTPEQVAASEELEGSRAQYNLRRRLELLFLHTPDTVTAARVGDPPLEDPPPTVAPTIVKQLTASYVAAIHPGAPVPAANAAPPAPAAPADSADQPAAAPPASTAPPTLSDVPVAGSGDAVSGAMTEATPAASSGVGNSGASLGVEVLTPGATHTPIAGSGVSSGSGAASTLPAATGAPDPNNGLTSVGPGNTAPLPPIEKPTAAPDQVNDITGQQLPVATGPAPAVKGKGKKKTKAPAEDKNDESSSKKKPKKGLDKLNPF
jgi:outer membrane protein assembly factor BamD